MVMESKQWEEQMEIASIMIRDHSQFWLNDFFSYKYSNRAVITKSSTILYISIL